MQTAKVSEYRSSLSKYHQRIVEDHDPLRVAGRTGDVIVLPADDYENIIETMYILKDKVTMNSLLKTRAEMANRSSQDVGVGVKDGFKYIVEP